MKAALLTVAVLAVAAIIWLGGGLLIDTLALDDYEVPLQIGLLLIILSVFDRLIVRLAKQAH